MVDYFKQLSSEEKEVQMDERTGEVKGWKWNKISASHQNHFGTVLFTISHREIYSSIILSKNITKMQDQR